MSTTVKWRVFVISNVLVKLNIWPFIDYAT